MVKVRKIPGFGGFYKIAEDGRIWTCKVKGTSSDIKGPWKEMKMSVDSHGYFVVFLSKKLYKVHRLLLLTFVGPCPPGKMCRHLDGKPKNIALSNLVWGTSKANQLDRKRHGTGNNGEKNGNNRLTENKVRAIRKEYKWYKVTYKTLAIKYGVSIFAIQCVVRNKTWKHVV